MNYKVRTVKDSKTIEFYNSTDLSRVRRYVYLREQEGCECTVYEEREHAYEIINI